MGFREDRPPSGVAATIKDLRVEFRSPAVVMAFLMKIEFGPTSAFRTCEHPGFPFLLSIFFFFFSPDKIARLSFIDASLFVQTNE